MNNANATPKNEKLKAQTYVCTAVPFELGKVVRTQDIDSLLRNNIGASLETYLMRHQNGDWGKVSVESRIANDEGTKAGERVLSEYTFCGERIWIITEHDRSVTTVLLPS